MMSTMHIVADKSCIIEIIPYSGKFLKGLIFKNSQAFSKISC